MVPGLPGLQFETDAHLMASVDDRFHAPVASQLQEFCLSNTPSCAALASFIGQCSLETLSQLEKCQPLRQAASRYYTTRSIKVNIVILGSIRSVWVFA